MDMEYLAIQVELADFLAVKIPWCKTKPSSYCTTDALIPGTKGILKNTGLNFM
jgi:hypothetical protein